MRFFFGSGAAIWWHGSLFVAFLALLGTGIYACQSSDGPASGAPFIMLMLFFLVFMFLAAASPVNLLLWASRAGLSVWMMILLVPVSWLLLAPLWTFLFWATDPNYPGWLVPGRVLFFAYSLLIYGANLWLLWRARAG